MKSLCLYQIVVLKWRKMAVNLFLKRRYLEFKVLWILSHTLLFSRQVVGYGNSTEVTSRSQGIQTGSQSPG